jgi:ribose transport system ATP-binding protein
MFTLKSSAFGNEKKIPEKYAEKNFVSPPLSWENPPKGTKSFALAVTDVDVPAMFNFPRVFAHWMVYNIPAATKNLPEGASPGGKLLPAAAKELNSDLANFKVPGVGKGYAGPWPPDAAHRYVFTLYALKKESLDIPPEADYIEFVKYVLPQTIATATFIAIYGPAKTPMPTG